MELLSLWEAMDVAWGQASNDEGDGRISALEEALVEDYHPCEGDLNELADAEEIVVNDGYAPEGEPDVEPGPAPPAPSTSVTTSLPSTSSSNAVFELKQGIQARMDRIRRGRWVKSGSLLVARKP